MTANKPADVCADASVHRPVSRRAFFSLAGMSCLAGAAGILAPGCAGGAGDWREGMRFASGVADEAVVAWLDGLELA